MEVNVLAGFIEALQFFLRPDFAMAVFAGTLVGLFLGIIPGIGGTIGLALTLPFIFGRPSEIALPFMVALWGTTATSGSMTSILLNVPGTAVNAATILDGYPMTKKGEAARAIGAAVAASGAGGAVNGLVALAMIPLIMPMIMAVGASDLFFFILLGISLVAILSRGSMIKGLISGALGLILALVGVDPWTGSSRFTFGTGYLMDGIELVPLTLGLFAIPEMVRLAMTGGAIAKTEMAMSMRDLWQGVRDVVHHWNLWLRCTVGGFIIGVIPGVGGTAATFMAYAHAKQTSKHPELFGTGTIEGVIAPEAANNAKDGGSLLTTLALGIPGSSDLAILIGAFILLNLVPGPTMLRDHLPLSLSMVYVLVVANLIAVVICFFTARWLIKVALIPSRILSPLVIVIALTGAFAVRQVFNDITLTLAIALLGLVMAKFGFNRVALMLAFVLGGLLERYFLISFQAGGALFFMGRPLSMALIAIIIFSFAYEPIKNLIRRRKGA